MDERLYDQLSSLGLDIFLEPILAQNTSEERKSVNLLIGKVGINGRNIESVEIVEVLEGGGQGQSPSKYIYFDYVVRPE